MKYGLPYQVLNIMKSVPTVDIAAIVDMVV
jgi:hypothetical protein